MKQRHVILNQNSHGVYRCKCGKTWRDGDSPPCPAAERAN